MKMLSKPYAILFDWDNTLVDTWGSIHNAMNKTLDHYNYPLWELEAFKIRSHRSSRSLFPEIFKASWQDARVFFYERMKEGHLEQLKILPYAFELLTFLKEKQIPAGVISNKHREFLKREIDYLGWQDFFQIVVGSGDTAQDKPHPEPILLALKNMALTASPGCWYVGDTITDWQAGYASGCQPVAVWVNPDQSDDKTEFKIPYLESCYDLYLKVSSF